MIIGSGIIAKAFKELYTDNESCIIFASGVSNSKETRKEAFQRENELLDKILNLKKKIIYFSTTSLSCDKKYYNPYQEHKFNIEKKLLQYNSTIFRLPQIIGNNQNKNNLIPYIYNCIKQGTTFDLYINFKRSLLDVYDVVRIVNAIIKSNYNIQNNRFNIINPKYYDILEIVQTFENLLKLKGDYIVSHKIDNHIPLSSDNSYLCLLKKYQINFDDNYLTKTINKYYSL